MEIYGWQPKAGCQNIMKMKSNFTRLRIKDELFDKKIRAINSDFKNNIWMSTDNEGIYVYNPTEKRLINYKRDDGLASNSYFLTSTHYNVNNDMLYFGGALGVQAINTKKQSFNKNKPSPTITGIMINGKEESYLSNFEAPFVNTISLSSLAK